MIKVKESSSETSQTKKKPDRFLLQLSTKLFVVPSKGFLKIDVKNKARKSQEVLISLESAVFSIRDYEKELFPVQQSSMILKPSETKSFTIQVREKFPESFNFDYIRLASPEGHLTISHCDSKKEKGLEFDESNQLMCLSVEKDDTLNWGSFTQKMILDQETAELKQQKERYFKEREDFENKKLDESKKEKKSSKESESEKEHKGFECCCNIS